MVMLEELGIEYSFNPLEPEEVHYSIKIDSDKLESPKQTPEYLTKVLNAVVDDAREKEGLEHLISIAHGHLKNALTYTQMLPTHETGIRYFCLWALGMAVLNLKKIKQNLNFNDSTQAKISRNSVKATIITTRLTGRSNFLLSLLFNFASRGLATPDWQYSQQQSPSTPQSI